MYLTCDLFGAKRDTPSTNPTARQRRWNGSKKIHCGFKVAEVKRFDGRWELRIFYGKHNHYPVYMSGHGLSPLSKKELEIIKDLSKSHVPPKKIMAHLKQMGLGLNAYMKQIYNAKDHFKKEARGDHTVMQHLIVLLEEHKYYMWIRTDETTHEVIDLMWAHPQSVELLSKFPYVILLDSTYKTNQYKMPLLKIVGVTSVGRNFTVGVVFMRHENENHYTWVLQRLKRLYSPDTLPSVIVTDRVLGLLKVLENVFPTVDHLLCLWHINMNVGRRAARCLGNSKSRGIAFVRGPWQNVVTSLCEEDFNRNYMTLMDEYANYPQLIEYLQDTWIIYKEKFVRACTDYIFHLGNTATSRVESNHRALKRWLDASTCGFDTFWAQYHSQITDQLNEILNDFAKSKRIRAKTINVPVFKILSGGIVTHAALKLLDAEMETGLDSYTHFLRTTYGLPCKHEIDIKVNSRGDLFYAEDVHLSLRTTVLVDGNQEKNVGSVSDHRTQAIFQLDGLIDELRQRSEIEIIDVTGVVFERMHPGEKELNETPVVDRPRGRPQNDSTRRDNSAHEYPLYPTPDENNATGRGRGRGRGNRGRSASYERSSRNCSRSSTESGPEMVRMPQPDFLRNLHFCRVPEFVTWTYIRGDGNCGNRSIACAVKDHEVGYL
ncbi:PREDICTED: protein FAR1-RELATED SEQUENCE 4-like [Erythranthe guttata]|uniref:protein FAR1-RELATED SEQUENCE 4-like n=1 Tax=Erythranthe guttata TaxID=4155 RepID=UPI00064DDACF|nr:PREDICTED: protein FAR1-RELATED SEQUENCE 4-like [Erythranthe guttata]|eukprot:XP_012853814.1 PREDICTED: protein FAR1-RELATED SEQUENCE 4-like [Erythranthe guttata]